MERRANLIISLVLMSVGLTYFFYGLKKYDLGTLDELGAGLMPFLMGILLTALSFSLFVSYFFKKKTSGTTGQSISNNNYKKPAAMIALTIGYFLAINWLGFFISTFTYIFLGIKLIGAEGILKPSLITIAIVVCSYFLFVYALKLQVPGL